MVITVNYVKVLLQIYLNWLNFVTNALMALKF